MIRPSVSLLDVRPCHLIAKVTELGTSHPHHVSEITAPVTPVSCRSRPLSPRWRVGSYPPLLHWGRPSPRTGLPASVHRFFSASAVSRDTEHGHPTQPQRTWPGLHTLLLTPRDGTRGRSYPAGGGRLTLCTRASLGNQTERHADRLGDFECSMKACKGDSS